MSALKAAIHNPQSHLIHMRAALFHSTPVLERKRRNYWQSSRPHQYSNPYSKRFRKIQSKKAVLRNISAYAEHLFQLVGVVRPRAHLIGIDHDRDSKVECKLKACQLPWKIDIHNSWVYRLGLSTAGSWQDDLDGDDPSSSKGTSWFKKQYVGPEGAANKGRHHHDRRSFQFCEDEDEMDFDVDKMFRSAFGRNQHFYWSFIDEEATKWRSPSRFGNNYWNYGNWRFRVEEDYEYSTESESSDSDISLDRQALGLSAAGPLKLEDVKNAYRACALKWHPDRHQGSSKRKNSSSAAKHISLYAINCSELRILQMVRNPNTVPVQLIAFHLACQ
ncbi:hypothetical protein JRO89_XS12G0151700 [Xanthoceras sorbifolium]|uniref:J domain-containing protein n=1 Tax=Xanthoceras sorbifolium TaxID=99658 RepID=A0ABQ8HCQ9_9ROSI|nr:hypothetical protein JRO89_XS12G0151700 [Xanthoceras sorbifolium]